MTLGSRVITITNGILIVVSSKTSYCQNHGNCMQVVRFFLTRIINVKSVVLKSYFQGGTVSEPVWNSTRDMRANKLQALLIFRSQGSFSQLLVHKKCARLTTVKTCSVGPWLSMRCCYAPRLSENITWDNFAKGCGKHDKHGWKGKAARTKETILDGFNQCIAHNSISHNHK